MKIIVTGGAGFIGSHLSEKLLSLGHLVSIIDNFNDFYAREIKEGNVSFLKENENCTIYEKDITAFEDMDNIFKKEKPECVFHLAARAGVRPSLKDPHLYEKVNITGTINILELCRKHKVKKLFFASSSSVYGEQNKVPFNEEYPLDHIVSPYAATKAAGEHFCRCYSALYGLKIMALRFFTVYGPRQRPEMAICKFARRIDSSEKIEIFGDGTSSRDYTYIDDIIQGLLKALEVDFSFEIINLGESTTIYLKDLVSIIENNLGKKADIIYGEYQKGDVTKTFADIKKAENILGYDPRIDIKEGVRRFIEWYKANYTKGIYNKQKNK